MLFSVIIAAYNAEDNIFHCVSSVLANFDDRGGEVIVVNDGSTDRTQEILEESFCGDPRVVIVNQPNQGVGAARENALRRVRGEFITFCDSDDWVEPDWLESMYEPLMKYDADIVVFGAIIEGRKEVYDKNDVKVWNQQEAMEQFLVHRQLNGTLWTKLFKAELLADLHFDKHLRSYEDSDFVWQILCKSQKVVKVREAKYHWRIDGDSLSNGKPTESRLRSNLLLMKKLTSDPNVRNDRHMAALASRLDAAWTLSALKSMYGHGIQCDDLERSIRHKLIRNFRVAMQVASGIADKAFLVMSVLLPPAARAISVRLKARQNRDNQ